jgi:hypothetical protein
VDDAKGDEAKEEQGYEEKAGIDHQGGSKQDEQGARPTPQCNLRQSNHLQRVGKHSPDHSHTGTEN